MSFANYLSREGNSRVPEFSDLQLRQEPDELKDAARVSDTITYVGVGSYASTTSTLLTPSDTDFTPLFYDPTGVSPPKDEYLRVKTSLDTNNFEQLANVSYKVYINSTSVDKFNVRLAAYDSSLNRLEAYPPILYDPSNNTRDPPVIDGFTLYGYGVDYPVGCEYVFLEVDTSGNGSIQFEYDYAHSQLEVAFNTSSETGTPAKNVFGIDYFISIRDISGVEKDLTAIEADIDTLDNSVNTIEGDLVTLDQEVKQTANVVLDLSQTALRLSGGTMTGILDMDSNPITGLDAPSSNDEPATKAYVDSIESDVSGAISTLDSKVSTNENDISSLQSSKLNKSGDTMSGALNMGNKQIKQLATPSASSDSATKGYVDTETAKNLSKSGGTLQGVLNMGSNKIENCATPSASNDVATKGYVDSELVGGPTIVHLDPVPNFSGNKNDTAQFQLGTVDEGQFYRIEITFTIKLTTSVNIIDIPTPLTLSIPWGQGGNPVFSTSTENEQKTAEYGQISNNYQSWTFSAVIKAQQDQTLQPGLSFQKQNAIPSFEKAILTATLTRLVPSS